MQEKEYTDLLKENEALSKENEALAKEFSKEFEKAEFALAKAHNIFLNSIEFNGLDAWDDNMKNSFKWLLEMCETFHRDTHREMTKIFFANISKKEDKCN